MAMKILSASLVLLGMSMLLFAGMAYIELHNAATSTTTPTADSMPLTKIVGPELFDPKQATAKPAIIARKAFNRIYMIGGVGMVLAIIGLIVLAIPQARGTKHDESS